MDAKQRKIWEGEKDDLYKAIGKFIVEFEIMCDDMRDCIINSILYKAGLRNQMISQQLLTEMTAGPLLSLLESLLLQTEKFNVTDEEVVKNLIQRSRKLIKDRNDVIHCRWFISYLVIGIGNDEDMPEGWDKAWGVKFCRTRGGVKLKTISKQKKDFQKMGEEASQLARMFRILRVCLLSPEPFPLEKYLVQKKKQRKN